MMRIPLAFSLSKVCFLQLQNFSELKMHFRKLESDSNEAIISFKLEIIEPISGMNSIKPSGITAIPKFLPLLARLAMISTYNQ